MSKKIIMNNYIEKKSKVEQNNEINQLDQNVPSEQSDSLEHKQSAEHDLEKINFAELPIASDIEE